MTKVYRELLDSEITRIDNMLCHFEGLYSDRIKAAKQAQNRADAELERVREEIANSPRTKEWNLAFSNWPKYLADRGTEPNTPEAEHIYKAVTVKDDDACASLKKARNAAFNAQQTVSDLEYEHDTARNTAIAITFMRDGFRLGVAYAADLLIGGKASADSVRALAELLAANRNPQTADRLVESLVADEQVEADDSASVAKAG